MSITRPLGELCIALGSFKLLHEEVYPFTADRWLLDACKCNK